MHIRNSVRKSTSSGYIFRLGEVTYTYTHPVSRHLNRQYICEYLNVDSCPFFVGNKENEILLNLFSSRNFKF